METSQNTKIPEMSWKDCFLILPTVINILWQHGKFWIVSLLFLATVMTAIPDAPKYETLSRIAGLALGIGTTAASCIVIPAFWKHELGQKWEPTGKEIARTGPAWLMSDIYWVGVLIGLVLIVAPGVFLAVRGSLALAFMCIEQRGPKTAINDSWLLTKNHFWFTARYFGLPVVIALSMAFIYPVCVGLVMPDALDDEAFMSMAWNIAHLPLVAARAVATVSTVLLEIVVSAMQVRLYNHLKNPGSQGPRPW